MRSGKPKTIIRRAAARALSWLNAATQELLLDELVARQRPDQTTKTSAQTLRQHLRFLYGAMDTMHLHSLDPPLQRRVSSNEV
jgi:hypothetical protein